MTADYKIPEDWVGQKCNVVIGLGQNGASAVSGTFLADLGGAVHIKTVTGEEQIWPKGSFIYITCKSGTLIAPPPPKLSLP